LSAISASVPVAPSRLNREVSPAVDALIGELLGKDPTRRPNATEVIERVADLSVRSAGSVVPGSERGSPSPYVGRGREAAELRRAYHDAVRGSGVIVEVSGEPGIGKTTLVEHVLHDLGTDPTASYIARGRCSDRLAGTEAYLPFLEAFDSLLDGPGRETVARLLKTVGPSWYAQIAQRGEIKMSGDSQERLKRELVAVLEQLSIQRPLLLFFEDVHWADASTVDLLSYVAARFDGLRVLIIVSYRPSDLELTRHPILPVLQALRGKGVSRELVVDFLTREETAAYLAQVFPGGRFPELGSLIHEKTEGNPLFMVELVRNLRTRQIVVESGDTWELTQPIAEIAKDLPPSIRSLIQRKIDLLDEDERRLLVAASVQGVQFDTAVVAKAIDRGAEEVEAVLDVLERRHGFVHLVGEESLPDGTPSSQFRFVHVLYQKGLYATLRPVRRTSLTKAVAVALIGFYQGNTAPVAAQLAVLLPPGGAPRQQRLCWKRGNPPRAAWTAGVAGIARRTRSRSARASAAGDVGAPSDRSLGLRRTRRRTGFLPGTCDLRSAGRHADALAGAARDLSLLPGARAHRRGPGGGTAAAGAGRTQRRSE
jgi:hypothetical protein